MSWPAEMPHDTTAERGLLGAVLVAGRVPPVARLVRPEDIYWPLHRAIYAAMLAIDARGEPVTTGAIVRQMHHDETLWILGREGEHVH